MWGSAQGSGWGLARSSCAKQPWGARDDYVDSGNTDADARDRAISLNTWTNVALVSSLVVGCRGSERDPLRPRARGGRGVWVWVRAALVSSAGSELDYPFGHEFRAAELSAEGRKFLASSFRRRRVS